MLVHMKIPLVLIALLVSASLPARVQAQASGSGHVPNAAMAWPPVLEKDGYLPSAPGYVRFSEGPALEAAIGGCPERGSRTTRVNLALGPVDADGWVQHIDLLQCGSGKRLLRIKAPDAQLAPYTDARSMILSRSKALASFYREGAAGIQIRLRNGDVKWLDARLKEVSFDPERTLFLSGRVLHLLDEPGLFLPYLKPGARYQLPKGMSGFRYLEPEVGAFDRAPESFRQRLEVWETANGRRFGACGRTADSIEEWAEQPPACGPRYRQVEAHVLSWDTPLVKRATNLVILGELEDGRWEVAHAQDPAISRANYAERMGKPEDLATAEEMALLTPQPKDTLLAHLGEVHGLRMQQRERINDAFDRIYQARKDADARMAAAMAAQQRAEMLAQMTRRQQEAEARRAAVAAALASGDERCWKTAECGLSFRQRYNMAIAAGDRGGAHQIALSAYGRDRSVVIEDIRRDWAGVAPGRGPSYWPEERVHALALRDHFVRQGIGADIWKHAERWAAMRDYNTTRRNADTFWSRLADMGPVETRSISGSQPLSSLEQDYYVGKGYVVVRKPRHGF